MDFLESLIASAKAQAAAKASRPKGTIVRTSDPAERENLYAPHRLVALFHQTTCASCGTITTSFEGLFEERKHIRVSDLHLVRQPFVPLADNTLPRVRKYLPHAAPYCEACVNLDSYREE